MMPKLDGIEVCRRLKADRDAAVHADHPGDRQGGQQGCRRRARSRRRRVSDQADRSDGAGGAGEVGAAHQGAARSGAGAGRPTSRRGTARSSSASSEQLSEIERDEPAASASCRRRSPSSFSRRATSACWRAIAATITVVFCDLRGFTAFSETAEPEEVMSVLREYHAAARQADPQIRRHGRALCRRRHHGLLQRSAAMPGSEPARGANGDRDARAGGRALRSNGASTAMSSASASALRTAMQRSAASASRADSTMAQSAPWSISRPGCARMPRMGRS